MRKGFNIFIWCLIVLGFPLLAWAGYSLVSEAHAFSKHGLEKQARVIALEQTSGGKSVTWYYRIEIDGRQITAGFARRLPMGQVVSVLVLPDAPDRVTLGDRNSTWFDLFSHALGGKIMASLALLMFVFLSIKGPSAFVEVIRNRRAFFNLR